MADDDVQVKFGAQVAGLVSGMREATASTREFVSQAKTSVSSLVAPFEQFKALLIGIASIAAGGYLFKDIIDSTTRAASETNKLSKSFGISLDEANRLRVELTTLGITVDDYTSMAFRMDRQVKQNEAGLQSFGLKTRDASGHLLNQQELMLSAVNWLKQFKDGTDRNIAAQTIFGRNISDVNALLRMTSTTAERAKKDLADLGLVVTPEDLQRSREYKIAIAELSLTFEGIKKAIGDAVLPYLTSFANWFRAQGPNMIANMKETVRTVIEFAFDLANGFVKFAVMVANGIFNIFVIAQYLRAKLGFTTVADAQTSIDSLEAMVGKLEQLRDKAMTGLKSLRETVMSGGPAPTGTAPDISPGSKSATGLIQADQIKAAALAAIETERRVLQIGLQGRKDIYEADLAAHRITQEQKVALVMGATQQQFEAERALLDREKLIGGITVAERQKVLDRIKILEAEHDREIKRLSLERTEAIRQQYERVFSAIQGAWDSNWRDLLSGQITFVQAFKKTLADLIIQFISFVEKMALEWAAAELAKTTATTTAVAARTAAEQTGAAASLFTLFAGIGKAIAASVSEVFAGVTAFFAPTLGPAAPAAGAGVAASVAAAATLPSLDAGGYVIKSGYANIHAGETVTPADVVRGGRDGGPTINVNFQHHGNLTKQQLRDHAYALARELKGLLRDNPTLRPTY